MSNSIIDVRVVEPGRGAAWWVEGWRTFTSNLWTWLGIMVIFIIISILIAVVPYVGDVGHSLLAPVFIGGLMLGCNAIDRGEPLKIAHLFEGFQGANFVPLLIIGAIDILLTLLCTRILSVGLLGGSMFDMMRSAASDPSDILLQSASTMGLTGLLSLLAALVIMALIGALNWFAPALVVLRGATSIEAMKASFVASWRNWAAFLVYGLIGLAVVCGALVVFGGIAAALGLSAFSSMGIFGAIMGLVFILFIVVALTTVFVLPTLFGTMYAGYRDTLAGDGDAGHDNPAYQ